MQKFTKHAASFLVVLFSLIMCSVSYAKAILNIVPSSTTARSIKLATTGSFSLIYKVTNDTKVNVDNLVIRPYYNIPDGALTLTVLNNQCKVVLPPGGSCNFTLNIQSNRAFTGKLMPTVCVFNGATCSVPLEADRMTISTGGTAQSVAYVVNSGVAGPVSICTVNANGTLNPCTAFTDPTFDLPQGIILNASATRVYITNYFGGTVSICPIIPGGAGQLAPCTSSDGNGTFNFPIGAALNPAGNFLYVSNNGVDTVAICPVLGDGSLGPCTTSAGNGTFSDLQAITINPDGTYAYVCNGDSISICPINADGSFGTCTINGGNGTYNQPQGVSFSPDSTTAYVGNFGNNTVSLCPVLQDGSGGFGTCVVANGNGTFDFDSDDVVGLFMASPTYFGYVPNNGNDTVSICPVNGTALGTCVVNSDSTYNQPTAVALSYVINP